MGGFPYRLAGSSGNTRVALMYASSGAAHLTLTAMAVAKIMLGRVVAGRGNPWLTAVMISAGFILAQMADKEFLDRVRLVVRYSMWGKKNGDMPGENEKALIGRWWIELRPNQEIGAAIRPITISNIPMRKADLSKLMSLEAKHRNGNIKIRETFERNNYLLNVAAQFPPTAITAEATDNVLYDLHVSHHTVNVSSIQTPTIIESVRIKLISIPSEQALYDKVYKYKPEGEEFPLLSLLFDSRNRRINSTDEALWAERFSIVFVDGSSQNAPRNFSPTARYIPISADTGHSAKKRVEIDIAYVEGCRLPLRLEQEFYWAVSGLATNDLSHP